MDNEALGRRVSEGCRHGRLRESSQEERVDEAWSVRMRHEIPEEIGQSASVG